MDGSIGVLACSPTAWLGFAPRRAMAPTGLSYGPATAGGGTSRRFPASPFRQPIFSADWIACAESHRGTNTQDADAGCQFHALIPVPFRGDDGCAALLAESEAGPVPKR